MPVRKPMPFNLLDRKDKLLLLSECFGVVAKKVANREVTLAKGGCGSCALAHVSNEVFRRLGDQVDMYSPLGASNELDAVSIWAENDGRTEDYVPEQGPGVTWEDPDGMADILLVASFALKDEAEAL